ncbi:MAG: hypothetical protein AAFW66_12510 [Pseudomonadota bacterium]
MQSIPFFSSEDVEAQFNTERFENPQTLSAQCPVTGIYIDLKHSHYEQTYTLEIYAPHISNEFLYYSFPDRRGRFATSADLVNDQANVIISGLMVQYPKLDQSFGFATGKPTDYSGDGQIVEAESSKSASPFQMKL